MELLNDVTAEWHRVVLAADDHDARNGNCQSQAKNIGIERQ